MLASVLPAPTELPPLTMGGSQWDAIFWGFVASVSLLVSASLGARFKPSGKTVAGLLAFTAGVLIALLSYDLIDEAFTVGGLAPSFLGMAIGLLTYVIANRMLSNLGNHSRRSCEHGGKTHASIGAMALVMGALVDGIPEAASIGIGLLETRFVSAAVIAGVFIANIPEGLASGAGLSRTGMSQRRILLIWGLVTLACTVSSWLAFVLLRESGPFVQATLMSIAGGGILAMTLQTVVPEAFDGTNDLISVLGAIGFAVVFTLSHVVIHATP
jgi:ZIP family zinc transporter